MYKDLTLCTRSGTYGEDYRLTKKVEMEEMKGVRDGDKLAQ